MKVLLPARSAAKKGLLYFLIVGLCSSNLQARGIHESVAYVLAAGMGVSAAWAIYEKMSKSSFKQKADQLQMKVDSYKSDEQIKELWINTLGFLVPWEKFLVKFKAYLDSVKSEDELAEDAINCIFKQIKKYDMNCVQFGTKITAGINDLENRMNALYIKGEAIKNKPILYTLIEKAIGRAKSCLAQLQEYNAFYELHKNYIAFMLFLDQGLEKEYAQEIQVAHLEKTNIDYVIEQIIKSKGAQILFPYLFYAQDLQFQLDKLAQRLNNISNEKLYAFQENKILKAKEIYASLKAILNVVSASDTLAKEKTAKVEYDRKEQYIKADIIERKELLRLETKERESKISQQNAIAEARLIDQKNRERLLSNERAKIEKDKKDLEYKSKENALQLARIHEGYGIKKALDENNSKWRADYDKVTKESQRLSQDSKQREAELKDLRIKISKLESDIKATHTNRSDLDRYIRRLEMKISNVARALDALENSTTRPPFNVQVVDGLPGYIQGLTKQVRQLKTLVS